MKIAGVSIWIWLLGIFVSLGALVAALDLVEPAEAITPGEGKGKREVLGISERAVEINRNSTAEVRRVAEGAFSSAKVMLYAYAGVMSAEIELSKQVTAGKSQLMAMKLADAKVDLEKHEKELDQKMGELIAAENDSGKKGAFSDSIRNYRRNVEIETSSYYSALRNFGILDPTSKERFERFIATRGMTFDEVCGDDR